jgi:hypothetical protein
MTYCEHSGRTTEALIEMFADSKPGSAAAVDSIIVDLTLPGNQATGEHVISARYYSKGRLRVTMKHAPGATKVPVKNTQSGVC